MDVSQYLLIFIDETKEHLQSLNEQLLVLEKEPNNKETIDEIFRAAHSLKGMAGTMGYKRMQKLTHEMESLFTEIRDGNIVVKSELVDVLFRGLDLLEKYLDNIITDNDEGIEDADPIIKDLNRYLAEETGMVKAEEGTKNVYTANSSVEYLVKHDDVLYEHEIKAINKAKEEGENTYRVTIYLNTSCILKAARAFLVFKSLEEHGDIIKSTPSADDIEDEKFDYDFTVCIISSKTIDEVKNAVLNVSEIAAVAAEVVDINNIEVRAETKVQEDTNMAVTGTEKAQAATAVMKASDTVKTPLQTGTKTPAKTTQQTPNKQQAVAKRSVRVDIEKLDDLMNIVSELIIAKNGLVSMSNSTERGTDGNNFTEQIEYLERITTDMHTSVMKVRMVPIESVVNRFPRMIRDLSKKLGKKMELYMTGEDTELDRTVIDEIGDPLMHLLRNSADHGLETNDERVQLGKPEVGSIFLDAYQEGNNVVIEVRDDGRGIDVEKVRHKAIEKGVISEEQADDLTDKEVIELLFRPSFSTTDTVSDVSGRGVGLDVVKTSIENLGGSIETKTALGKGSSFIIRLPLTLAIIQALMVELGNEKYAIPLGSIDTIENVNKSEIKYVQSKEVIHLRENVIPLVRLRNILDVEDEDESKTDLIIVIVKKGDKSAGLIVDNLIGQLEIVIKSIGKYINNSKLISGATILGDGEIALILDVNILV